MKEYAILLDSTTCTGCNTCMYKCIQENRLQDSASRGLFTSMALINDDGIYHRRCMHCKEPACVEVCSEGALTKSGYGPVLFDAGVCAGCGECVEACPFGVPQVDPVAKKMAKCSMCAHRIKEDRIPACVEACPTGSLQFGEYKQIVSLAQKGAAESHLHLYGLQENGGGHVLVLLKEDPLKVGYPKVAHMPPKSIQPAYENASVPVLAAIALGGLKKFSDRRDRIERASLVEGDPGHESAFPMTH